MADKQQLSEVKTGESAPASPATGPASTTGPATTTSSSGGGTASTSGAMAGGTAAATPTPRRPPGHRSTDARDTVAEMAARAQEISMEAGSKVASAMKDVISAAAGLTGFMVESARDLVQYMVRRGQMTQEEADRIIREAEEANSKRKPVARAATPPSAVAVAPEPPPRPSAAATRPAAARPAAKTAPRRPEPKRAAPRTAKTSPKSAARRKATGGRVKASAKTTKKKR